MSFLEVPALLLAVFLIVAAGVLGIVLFFAAVLLGSVYGGLAFMWLMDRGLLPTLEWFARVYTYCAPHIRASLFWVWEHPKTALASASGLLFCASLASLTWYVYLDPSDAPDARVVLTWQAPEIGYIHDRNGAVVMRAAYQFRQTLTTEQFMSERYAVMQSALIAAEDKRFWHHEGVDWIATLKEGTKSFLGFGRRGASSIPQQVVRNLLPNLRSMVARQNNGTLAVNNPLTRTLASLKGIVWANKSTRKGREIKYAVRSERQLATLLGSRKAAKEFLLTTYANFVNLGGGVYGVEYGAQHYFGKGADKLTPPEAAYLASLIPGPNVYSQTETDAQVRTATGRRDAVLKRMADIGAITRDQLKAFRAQPLGLVREGSLGPKTEAPAVVQASIREIEARGFSEHNLHNGDVQLTLTVDMELQRILNQAAYDSIRGSDDDSFAKRYPLAPLPQAAGVVLRNRDGAVLAMFGGFDSGAFHNYKDYNRATEARRQPGSTFKIVDIFAAVSVGFGPESPVSDAPFAWCDQTDRFGNCILTKSISNYKNERLVPSILQEGSARSVNTVFARLMRDQVGETPEAKAVAEDYAKRLRLPVVPGAAYADYWARQMGITSYAGKRPVIAMVLGAQDVHIIEMANVIRTACTGIKAEPYLVSTIIDRTGATVYANRGSLSKLPLAPEKLAIAQQILRGNVKTPHGTGRGIADSARFPVEVRGKTGTSNDHRDGWFCGCTDGTDDNAVSVAVWVGYDDFGTTLPHLGIPLEKRAAGGRVALPIVRRFLAAAYGEDKPLGIPPRMPDEGERNIEEYNAKYHGVSPK